MLKPYKVVEEDGDFIVYEFHTIYLYLVCFILVVMLFGYLVDVFVILLVGGIAMLLYFVLI